MPFKKRLSALPYIVQLLLRSHYTAIKFYQEALSPEITTNDLYTLVTYNTVDNMFGLPGNSLVTTRIEEPIKGVQSLPYTWTVMAAQLGCALSHLRRLVSDDPATMSGAICSPALYLRIHNMMGISVWDTAPAWDAEEINPDEWWEIYKHMNLFRLQFLPREEILTTSLEELFFKGVEGADARQRRYILGATSSRANGVRFFNTLKEIHGSLNEFFSQFPELHTPNVLPEELAEVTQDMAEIYRTMPHTPGPRNGNYLAQRARSE